MGSTDSLAMPPGADPRQLSRQLGRLHDSFVSSGAPCSTSQSIFGSHLRHSVGGLASNSPRKTRSSYGCQRDLPTVSWSLAHERCIVWNDPSIGVSWPDVGLMPQLSAKDRDGAAFASASQFD